MYVVPELDLAILWTVLSKIQRGGNILPDTCSKQAQISLNISGVTNNTGNNILVQLFGDSANTFKYILSSNGTVNFTPQELVNFQTNSNLPITISFASCSIWPDKT